MGSSPSLTTKINELQCKRSIFPTLRLELPRQQRLDLLDRLRGRQRGEQAAQVRVGFELVGSSSLHQAVKMGARLGAAHRVGEEPVAPS